MERLKVDLGQNSYDIIFEKDFLQLTQALKEIGAPEKLLVVTDSNVEPLYAREVERILLNAGYDVAVYSFPAGEKHKDMKQILGICNACLEHQMDRGSMVLALGGGVVGDMAGFAAAIYMRGIRFVQLPTTLLSQSDSSVGGKTGIDFGGGKNLLGAFHQPKLVYINVSALKTLPEREFISGIGEVIKHGMIADRVFFDELLGEAEHIKALEPEVLIAMAKKNCWIKAQVVMQDEHELGIRANLNFGHTIGHGIEAACDFALTHGHCVALGMLAAARIACVRGILEEKELARLKEILVVYGFELEQKLPAAEQIFALMQKDKKKARGKLKFILPVGIGKVIQTTDVTQEEIKDAIAYIGGSV